MAAEASPTTLSIKCSPSGQKISFTRDKSGLIVDRKNKKLTIPYRQVLNAVYGAEKSSLEVTYLHRKKAKGPLTLYTFSGELEGGSGIAQEWVEALLREAYENTGVSQKRRLKILVNPFGGTKKGALIYKKTVEPILKAAQCVRDTTFTTHGGHAFEIAKEIQFEQFDAIITVSGDGLIHEVVNGLANHKSPRKALKTPIAPIPTGSGNGLSLNILGIDHGFDVTEATLNAIKGRPMMIDLFSVTQNGKRTISFMSQAMGLMADLDIGTEHLRWMGDTRFMVGLLRGILQWKPCPVKLSYKLVENDKMKMTAALESSKSPTFPPSLVLQTETSDALPDLKYNQDDNEGWTDFEEPILYVYAGKGPYVGRDYMAFPVSLPDDGLVDIMIMPLSTRKQMLSAIAGAATGDSFWTPELTYVKAHAYRIKPLAPKGALAIDGESFPFEDFQVEVHPKMGTLLSPHGFYAAEFPSPRSPMSPLKSAKGTEFPGLAQAQEAQTAP